MKIGFIYPNLELSKRRVSREREGIGRRKGERGSQNWTVLPTMEVLRLLQ
jgi:hypothetical protein